jgi:hypothetical protein
MRIFKELKVSFDKPEGFWARLFAAKRMGVKIELIDICDRNIGGPFSRVMSPGDRILWTFGNYVCGQDAREEEDMD